MDNELKGNYLLINTDGYSLDDYTFYNTEDDAKAAMKKAYNELHPDNNDESSEEMSYIGETDAILYANGESVNVWKIIKLTK